MGLEAQYQSYRCAQHDFVEANKLVNEYVKELYLLPKQLVENTSPALDKYIKDYSFPEANNKNVTPFEVVLDFIDQLDDLTNNAMNLFNEHKLHADKSKRFLKKVDDLSHKTCGKIISEYAVDFIELTPELTELHNNLKHIKKQADDMVDRLESLELRWSRLKVAKSASA